MASVVILAGLLLVVDLVFPPPLERAKVISPVVTDRHGEWLHAFATPEGRWRFEADLKKVDNGFLERLIRVEDKRFYDHWGVDLIAVGRATITSARAGEIVSGASTITMQTVRLLEPRQRTLTSKIIEVFRALQIERRLSKAEILETYLTLAPYGGNIEGIEAASRLYFGKTPLHLTDAEQALLLALPQAPEARRPDLHPMAAIAARSTLLEKLTQHSLLEMQRMEEAKVASLPVERVNLSRSAYHASYRLARREDNTLIRSTLDRALQGQAEVILSDYVERMEEGTTAAAIIVDNDTREVRAHIGSSGLKVAGGWIDLTAAVRSPGSTLKPFIYGIAFDDGLAGPDTVVEDMPRSFGGYSPENFDRTFRGEVRVREALQHSLNIPAVEALDRIGVARFSSLLETAGIRLKAPKRATQKPSLAVALGGAGVSAQELATLYTGLANDGDVKPLRWSMAPVGEENQGFRLLTEESASRISDILAVAPSLKGRAPSSLARKVSKISFKTGTSYGYRDAWSAGYNSRYTVVVWIGKANGTSRPGQTGRKAAAPLLFEFFDMLDRHDIGASERGDDQKRDDGLAVARFQIATREAPPVLIFPKDGLELFLPDKDRGFSLAARGGARGYQWYIDGQALMINDGTGRVVWHPEKPGFYNVTVIDRKGARANAQVRVRA